MESVLRNEESRGLETSRGVETSMVVSAHCVDQSIYLLKYSIRVPELPDSVR